MVCNTPGMYFLIDSGLIKLHAFVGVCVCAKPTPEGSLAEHGGAHLIYATVSQSQSR